MVILEKVTNHIKETLDNENVKKATFEKRDKEEKIELKELQEIKNNVELKGTLDTKTLSVGNLNDMVNHPSHYTHGKYECIDVIEDVTKDLLGIEAVCTANVIKYMWRWKLKNGLEDLRKANWYLNKLISKEEELN